MYIKSRVKITSYQIVYQNGINEMMNEIALEFGTPISNPTAAETAGVLDEYWVALNGDEIVGTIGVVKIGNNASILKRMFVKKSFRGKEFGVSNLLLQTALNWCDAEKINAIYLGTMAQFAAAHKFYERNGFLKISKKELPIDFVNNPVDSVFYKLNPIKSKFVF